MTTKYYNPYHLLTDYRADVNIIVGSRCTGKTWGISHYIREYSSGKTLILYDTLQEVLKSRNGNTPFYWDKDITTRCERGYKGDEEIYLKIALNRIKKDKELYYSLYDSYNFKGYKHVVIDDITRPTITKDIFNKFMYLIHTVVHFEPNLKIYIIQGYNMSTSIIEGFGISKDTINKMHNNSIICYERNNGLKIAVEKID